MTSRKPIKERVHVELEAIAKAQAVAKRLKKAIAERGHKNFLVSERLMSALVDGMRSAVTYAEIDECARELYGTDFGGVSVSEAFHAAQNAAFAKKETELARLKFIL